MTIAKPQHRLHPSRLVVLVFVVGAVLGTMLLLMPISTSSGEMGDPVSAFFTAVSAITVTGLVVVDTGTYWSGFGQAVILALIQLGGLGIVFFGVLIGVLIAGRISLTARLNMVMEARIEGSTDFKYILRTVVMLYLGFELVLAVWLVGHIHLVKGETLGDSLWHGIFHSVSAFNNAGFTTYPGGLTEFASDALFLLPMNLACFVGALGFPVLIEIHQRFWARVTGKRIEGRRRFSLHSRLTMWTSLILLVLGSLAIALFEWGNQATIGGMSFFDKWMNALTMSNMTRSAGFNSVDTGAMDSASWLVMDSLMFIGGGSASTAGGIKLTTFAVLLFIIYTEIRGENAVNIGDRRLPRSMQRHALTIVALYASLVLLTTIILLATTEFPLDKVMFEVLSAAATVGLSTGITAQLNPAAQILLSILMFVGRLGPIVVASALALRVTKRHFELPKERPLIG